MYVYIHIECVSVCMCVLLLPLIVTIYDDLDLTLSACQLSKSSFRLAKAHDSSTTFAECRSSPGIENAAPQKLPWCKKVRQNPNTKASGSPTLEPFAAPIQHPGAVEQKLH